MTIAPNIPTPVAYENCAPFVESITKIDGTTIDDAEDLDLVMSTHNLTEYSSNYSETTGSLWFYSKDEAPHFNAHIANDNNFKSFKYEVNLLGNTEAHEANEILKNATISMPLEYLGNFGRSL